MESATSKLANFIAELEFDALPEKVVHEAKRETLDIVGCALGGYLSQIGVITINFIRELGGRAECTVIGSGDKTSCVMAAYANSRMANALDADDTFYIVGHFGQSAVAAALALCERRGSSGRELITSVIAGFETAARVGIALGPSVVEEGKSKRFARYFGSGTAAVNAGTAAAAKALGLNREQTYHTLCIGAANIPVPTTRKWGENPAPLPSFKYADTGWCAQIGVTAALLAQKGTTGLPDIFDGDNGVLVSLGADFEKCDFDLMVAGLGEKWYIPETSYKPWPSCRQTHQALTAFSQIVKDNNISWEEIERVVIRGSEIATSPRFRNQDPVGAISCQFSHPHAIAMVAFSVELPLWCSPSVMNDPRVQEFRRKVVLEVQSEPAGAARDVPGQLAGMFIPPSVEVAARGQVFKSSAVHAKGDPWKEDTYFTDNELRDKFRKLAAPVHPASQGWRDQMEEIIEVIFSLDKVEDLGNLTRLLSPFSHPDTR